MAPGGGFYAFYTVDFLRRVSFCEREYYVPLTITLQTPPPKFSGAVPGGVLRNRTSGCRTLFCVKFIVVGRPFSSIVNSL